MNLLKISTFFLIIFLTACGYHLRGTVDLPNEMRNVYVESASASLQRELKAVLQASEAKLVESPSAAGVHLKFTQETMNTRASSINISGRANQFQVNYLLNYSAYDATGKTVLENQQLTIKREYFNDQTDILGKSSEEDLIRSEMIKQAANSLITRLQIVMQSRTR
jgi:LPS-assembly lipoprotein